MYDSGLYLSVAANHVCPLRIDRTLSDSLRIIDFVLPFSVKGRSSRSDYLRLTQNAQSDCT